MIKLEKAQALLANRNYSQYPKKLETAAWIRLLAAFAPIKKV